MAVFQDKGHKYANERQSLSKESRRGQHAQVIRGVELKAGIKLTGLGSLGWSSIAGKETDCDDKHQRLGFHMLSQPSHCPSWFSGWLPQLTGKTVGQVLK